MWCYSKSSGAKHAQEAGVVPLKVVWPKPCDGKHAAASGVWGHVLPGKLLN